MVCTCIKHLTQSTCLSRLQGQVIQSLVPLVILALQRRDVILTNSVIRYYELLEQWLFLEPCVVFLFYIQG